MRDMVIDRLGRNVQFRSNLLVGYSLSHVAQDLHLALCKSVGIYCSLLQPGQVVYYSCLQLVRERHASVECIPYSLYNHRPRCVLEYVAPRPGLEGGKEFIILAEYGQYHDLRRWMHLLQTCKYLDTGQP